MLAACAIGDAAAMSSLNLPKVDGSLASSAFSVAAREASRVLAGSSELIAEAWRWKQMMGGAMRQSGIVAAGCL